MNIIIVCFLLCYAPSYYYIWHTIVSPCMILSALLSFKGILFTQQAIALLPGRWYSYKKLKFHYFLFDFCYFTNFLTLVYIWVPSFIIDDSYRGELFTLCYSSAIGPVLLAIIMWKNSLVPHSIDKMTSLYIHLSSSITLWGIRW